MIIFRCDHCGREIKDRVHRIAIEAYNVSDVTLQDPINSPWALKDDPNYIKDELAEKVYEPHLCRECIKQIAKMTLGSGAEGGEAEISEGGG